MPEVNVGLLKIDHERIQCGFLVLDVEKKGKEVHLTLTTQGKGALQSAKLGKLPLPLKLQCKEGTTMNFVLREA